MSGFVDRILNAYALPRPLRWEAVEKYPHVYRVAATSAEASHYLKCYPANVCSRQDVQNEAELVAYLRSAGVSVAAPVANRFGEWVTGIGESAAEGCAALFERAAGQTIMGDHLSVRQCTAFGRLAGQMHEAMDAIAMRYPCRQMDMAELLDRPLEQIGPLLDDLHRRSIIDVVGRVREIVGELVGAGTPLYGLCHGDLYPANVTFNDADQPTIFDLQAMEYGWRSYDLAQFLWRASHSWDDMEMDCRMGRWEAFVRGYEEVRPLSAAEKNAVPAFVPARLIWYMAFRIRRGEDNLDHAYFTSRIGFLEAWMHYFRRGWSS